LALQKEGRPPVSVMDYVYFLFRLRVIIALCLIFISMFIVFKALSMANFSFVGPLTNGINFMLTVLVGVMYFNDKLHFGQYLGLVLILSGILVLSLSTNPAS
jgi:multidrug transporter EmrE-like cation transporter